MVHVVRAEAVERLVDAEEVVRQVCLVVHVVVVVVVVAWRRQRLRLLQQV